MGKKKDKSESGLMGYWKVIENMPRSCSYCHMPIEKGTEQIFQIEDESRGPFHNAQCWLLYMREQIKFRRNAIKVIEAILKRYAEESK